MKQIIRIFTQPGLALIILSSIPFTSRAQYSPKEDTLLGTVYFRPAIITLNSNAKKTLDSLAIVIQKHPEPDVTLLIDYSPCFPSKKIHDYSWDRCLAITYYLTKRGIAADKFVLRSGKEYNTGKIKLYFTQHLDPSIDSTPVSHLHLKKKK